VTSAARDAVKRLRAAGIAFSFVSSRPPRGLLSIIEKLDQTEPIGAFNGGMIVTPDLKLLDARFIDEAAARLALDIMTSRGLDVWLFTDTDWYLRDLQGAYVARERHTVGFEPLQCDNLLPLCSRAGKLVGSTQNFDLLAACERELQEKLGSHAEARRSQSYYLDVTPAGADKGTAVRALAARLGIGLDRVGVIGDQANDLPMFAVAGLSIAMGNGPDWVRAKASHVTATNETDGFAQAIDRFVLNA
jgi:Cof subfamily protein (haloacid dehalogenase superfamily)